MPVLARGNTQRARFADQQTPLVRAKTDTRQ